MRWWGVIWILVAMLIGIDASGQSTLSHHMDATDQESILKTIAIKDSTLQLIPKENEKKKPEVNAAEDVDFEIPGYSWFSRGLIILLGVVLLLFLLYQMASSRRRHNPENIAISNEIEDIQQIDTIGLYDKLVEGQDYRGAIRMRFLRLLKEMDQQKIIKWQKDKTNRIYRREISDQRLKNNFDILSSIFERSWYGNRSLDREAFLIADSYFAQFFNSQIRYANEEE